MQNASCMGEVAIAMNMLLSSLVAAFGPRDATSLQNSSIESRAPMTEEAMRARLKLDTVEFVSPVEVDIADLWP